MSRARAGRLGVALLTILVRVAIARADADGVADLAPASPVAPPPATAPTAAPAVDPTAAPAAAPTAAPAPTPAAVTLGGYLEAYYQLHAQAPSNRITNLRGFDDRSRTFTLASAAIELKAERGPLTTHLVVQLGPTSASYYLAEAPAPGTPSVAASGPALWRAVQTATLAVRAPHELTVEVGLFPSPIGPEVIPIKDNSNFSRSNLFVALPFYHVGARASRPLGGGWTATAHVYNGWNAAVDGNGAPSVGVSASYASATTTAQLLYLGGDERPVGAPEGAPWRHLIDAYVQRALSTALAIGAHADAGGESTALGTSGWAGAALYARYAVDPALAIAARADALAESVAATGAARAAPIVLPVRWVAEATLTLAWTPTPGLELRLELRHDHAAADLYFGGEVAGDGETSPYLPNRRSQDTATLGAIATF